MSYYISCAYFRTVLSYNMISKVSRIKLLRCSLCDLHRNQNMVTSSYLYSEKILKTPNIIKAESEPSETEKKKKKLSIERITLIGTDESITIATKEEAEKICKRRGLRLVKIVDFDTKTQRAIYKLMTGAQFLEEDRKQKLEIKKTEKKVEKMLTVNYNIGVNDLKSKLNQVIKWLNKDHYIKIIINGDESKADTMDKLSETIKTQIATGGKVTQKVVKPSMIRLHIVPLPKPKETTVSLNTEEQTSKV